MYLGPLVPLVLSFSLLLKARRRTPRAPGRPSLRPGLAR